MPIPWTTEPPAFGFTDGEPWLPMPEDWGALSVEAQERGPGSTLSLYRVRAPAAAARRRLRLARQPAGDAGLRPRRPACVVNVDAAELELPDGELVLASEPGITTTLPPNTAAWVRERN